MAKHASYVINRDYCGITYTKDILNKNESFLTHPEQVIKYKITTTFTQTIQIQKDINIIIDATTKLVHHNK